MDYVFSVLASWCVAQCPSYVCHFANVKKTACIVLKLVGAFVFLTPGAIDCTAIVALP